MHLNAARMGSVQDVMGATISIALDPETASGLAFIEGHGYRIGQIGSFVRIPLGLVDLFGIVSQVGAGAVPDKLAGSEPFGYRWVKVQLVGEGQPGTTFRRGISQYPTIGDVAYIVTESDLSRIYGHSKAPHFVRIGTLASAESIPALVDVNKLVTRHSAVLGATGAGKSTTVANLLLALSDPNRFSSARVVVLDIHGEYQSALRDRASVFRVTPNEARGERPLFIPYWAMSFDELLAVSLGELGDAERGAVAEKLREMKDYSLTRVPRQGVTSDSLSVDTPVPFSIHQLWFDFHRLVNATHTQAGNQTLASEALAVEANGNVTQPGDALRVIPPKYKPQSLAAGAEKIYLSSSPLNLRRPLQTLASRLRDPRYDFLFRPGQWSPNLEGVPQEDLDTLLTSWIGGSRGISILDLSGIPSSILTHLVGVLLRVLFDAMFWARNLSEGARERPLLLVLEEAHSYLGGAGNGIASRAARRLVKEGRKYGLGAMIVSQRPSEIDATILSQCGTLFAMRLANPSDRAHVTGAVPDNLEGLLNMLPALRTGEAIVVGESVQLPVRALIDQPGQNRRPDSADPLVYEPADPEPANPGGWNRSREPSDYEDVVSVWRKQDTQSPRVIPKEDPE